MAPVRRLTRADAIAGRPENDLDPRLRLLPDGVAFHAFKEDLWTFADITEVEALPYTRRALNIRDWPG